MAVVVKTYRGELEDLAHHGRVAVCDWEGNLLYKYGDAEKMTFARSAAKPMQAIAACESGALEHFGVTDSELALMCASHNGESFHVEAVRGLLAKAGLDETALLCGASYPIHPLTRARMQANGILPQAVHCDCSGKHAGMLLTAVHNGESLADYGDAFHPVQRRIAEILCDVFACEEKDFAIAIDGCGVPVHALPLRKLAQGYARMARPACFSPQRAAAVGRITQAMTACPEMVGGTGRICTDLMGAFGDRLFSKAGAAAFYGIGLKERGIGIAIKLEDGCSEFMPFVVTRVLEDLGVITGREALARLGSYLDPVIRNHAGTAVGRKEVCFHLERCEQGDPAD